MTLDQAIKKYGFDEAEAEMLRERAAILIESIGIGEADADNRAILMALDARANRGKDDT